MAASGCKDSVDSRGALDPANREWATGTAVFVDVAEQAGLRFRHFNGATGEFYFPEIMGGGCALLDYDNDGDLDVYVVQGALLGAGETRADAIFAHPGRWPPRNVLFRNDLELDPRGEPLLRFTEVTDSSGVGDAGFGMGCATGDYDNDGDIDLYVTNYGSNVLYRNQGDGTFENVTATARVEENRWSASAAFVDYDQDGWLDLFVTNYVDCLIEANVKCWTPAGARDYCSPRSYDPVPDRLFHNNGDGTFTDVSEEAGIVGVFGSGMGVACADYNGDGRIDIYVANDGDANQLWVNRGDGTFEDGSWLSGTAYNEMGMPEAGMGVTAGDFDQDGDEDLYLTHLRLESNTLYLNDGSGMFSDRTTRIGLGRSSTLMTGFGTGWFDYNNDTLLDLLVVNGGVTILESRARDPFPYRMPNQLLRNAGAGRFEDVTARAGRALEQPECSRGAAFGDIDNDGDVDVLVTNNNGPLRLLRNESSDRNGWLRLSLQGRESNRSAIGAVVVVRLRNGPALYRRVHADGSYCSASDLRLTIGLGPDPDVESVEVRWPSGRAELWRGLATHAGHTLREGEGTGTSP